MYIHTHLRRRVQQLLQLGLAAMLVWTSSYRPVAFAQETPTPTPTVDAAPNTDTPTPTPTAGADETTPTPTDTATAVTLSETPTTEESTPSALTVDNEASIETTVSATATTGNNTVQPPSQDTGGSNEEHSDQASPTATPTPTPGTSSSVTTGDAVAIASIDNAVNTTEVNSQVIYHTINLYMDETGTIDLSLPSELARLLVEQNPDQPTINAALTDVAAHNDATVETNVTLSANTGGNTASGSGITRVSTGDALTILSLLNRINFVMIDSVLHVAIINIYGTFTGNILLPDLPVGQGICDTCGSASATNSATVATNVTLLSDTGNNTVSGQNGTIATGDAKTAVNVSNLINTVLYGSTHVALYINTFGVWNGQFLGYATDGLPGTDTTLVDCTGCIGDSTAYSNASVTNSLSLSATTGNNTVSTGESGSIATGNAYTAANIINLVNTSLIRSFGLFGFINIFGTWNGSVGSKSMFPTPTPEPDHPAGNNTTEETTATLASADAQSRRESGGLLSVAGSNNVGDYVVPGDTVTLFINTKNTGTGRVYDTQLIIMLIKEGNEAGTVFFELGDVDAGRSKKLTTGLVLAKDTPPGIYTVRTAVYGYTGDERTKVNAQSENTFRVLGAAITDNSGSEATVAGTATGPSVMSASYQARTEPNILKALIVLLLLVPMYVAFRLTRDRHQLSLVFSRQRSLATRLRALQLFLL